MNPKDQIHYDIAELLEKIAHLNIKLAGTTKIHPVEIDLLRSYLTELDKLTDALPVMPLSKPSFTIPNSPQQEATTLPSFNTPLETEATEEPAATYNEPVAEHTVEEGLEQTIVSDSKESNEQESDTEESEAPAAKEPIIETEAPLEEANEQVDEPKEKHDTTEVFAFEDLAAPVTDAPEQTEEPSEQIVTIDTQGETETTETLREDEPSAEDDTASFIDAPVHNDEPVAETEPGLPTEETEEDTQVNTGPDLPIVETPLSYEPPVKEPETKRSINDMFSREGKEDLGSRFQFQNRKNLREMIDLSERYVFTKELFGGDADYYDKAIRQLNQFETLVEAKAFMENDLYTKYNWVGKEQVQKQFAKIVERRYA